MNVNSLSGYLSREDGEEILFSILTNGSNLPAAQVRERMDALVRELAADP
jgi:D-alanyl-D-alanine carboxypeptidase